MDYCKKWFAAVLSVVLTASLMLLGGTAVAEPAEGGFDLSWTAAEEGMVLLKNDNDALPLAKGSKIALLGGTRGQWLPAGGGSSGLTAEVVISPYEVFHGYVDRGEVTLYEPLSDADSKVGRDGLVLTDKQVSDAAAAADVAIVFIHRYSEEGKDLSLGAGGFELSSTEEDTVKKVTAAGFKKVIAVLNTNSVIETDWILETGVDAAVAVHFPGQAGAYALINLLMGGANFSGKTVNTWAKKANYYDSVSNGTKGKVVEYCEDIFVGYRQFESFDAKHRQINFPFGYGLSYTTFSFSDVKVQAVGDYIQTTVTVKNTGKVAGKEVVQVYFSSPAGKLYKAARELAGFAKTDLIAPGKSQTLTVTFPIADMSSYDDTGVTGKKSAYVMEAGDYNIYVGNSLVDAGEKGVRYTYKQAKLRVTEQLTRQLSPNRPLERAVSQLKTEVLTAVEQKKLVTSGTNTVNAPGKKITYEELCKDVTLLDDFVAQLSNEDLNNLLQGNPSIDGGDTGSIGRYLTDYGMTGIDTADGGVGLRVSGKSTQWPCSTLLACTWDVKLMEKIGQLTGREMILNNVELWLAPGVNIHRSPLCGRNFEYFSEDPLLTGKMAAAIVVGVQSNGLGCVVKHYAANNYEQLRSDASSCVSERAMREIYLRAFEIIVKESQPYAIMSSYNLYNGVETTERYDLITTVLRDEWGFDGIVMTDWYNNPNTAQSCLAGTDVIMPVIERDSYLKCLDDGTLRRSDLEACAKRVIRTVLKIDRVIQWKAPVAVYNGGKPIQQQPSKPTTGKPSATEPSQLPAEPNTQPITQPDTQPVTQPDTQSSTGAPVTDPTAPSQPDIEAPSDGMPVGLVVGIAAGGIAVVAAVIVLILVSKKKKA